MINRDCSTESLKECHGHQLLKWQDVAEQRCVVVEREWAWDQAQSFRLNFRLNFRLALIKINTPALLRMVNSVRHKEPGRRTGRRPSLKEQTPLPKLVPRKRRVTKMNSQSSKGDFFSLARTQIAILLGDYATSLFGPLDLPPCINSACLRHPIS